MFFCVCFFQCSLHEHSLQIISVLLTFFFLSFNCSATQIKKMKVYKSGFCSFFFSSCNKWLTINTVEGFLRLNFKMRWHCRECFSGRFSPHNSCFVKLGLWTAAEFLSFLGDCKLASLSSKRWKLSSVWAYALLIHKNESFDKNTRQERMHSMMGFKTMTELYKVAKSKKYKIWGHVT